MSNTIISCSDLFRSENLKLSHTFNINDKVLLISEDDDSEWCDKYPEFKHALIEQIPLFITSHDRDCDGTPLYAIGFIPVRDGESSLRQTLKNCLSPYIDIKQVLKSYEFLERIEINGISESNLKRFNSNKS